MVLIMKSNREIFDIVMDRKEEYESEKDALKKKAAAAVGAAAAIALCVTTALAVKSGSLHTVKTGAGMDSSDFSNNRIETDFSEDSEKYIFATSEPTSAYYDYPAEYINEQAKEEKKKDTENEKDTKQPILTPGPEKPYNNDKSWENTTAPVDGSGRIYGGDTVSGGAMIPVVPALTGAEPGVKAVGEKITDKEAQEYLALNKASIVSSLSASGVPADNITFSTAGYCHVSYDGTEGKQLEVRENFRDYLVYSSDKLIAIYTVTKENGKLSGTTAFGGPWFDDYNSFLKAHKGEKLLYVYAGYMEIIITPDNKCYNPQGKDVSDYLEGVPNPYEYFYSDSATYTP